MFRFTMPSNITHEDHLIQDLSTLNLDMPASNLPRGISVLYRSEGLHFYQNQLIDR
jgi:hypothetical protein